MKHTMLDLINVCSNHAPFKLHWTRIYRKKKKLFAVYESDTPVTLKSGQGHQSWYELVDPKLNYNHAEFEQCPPKSQR